MKPILSLSIGLVVGFVIGNLTPRRPVSEDNGATGILSLTDTARSSNLGSKTGVVVQDQLATLLAEDDQLRLHQFAKLVKPQDFEEVLDTIRVSMRRLTPPDEVSVFKAILTRYAATSPKEAIAYVKNLRLPDIQIHGFDAVLTGWAQSDLKAATDFITDPTSDVAISGSRFRNAAIRAVAEVVGREDFNKAIDWALALPESMSKTAHREITRMMVLSRPTLAAEFVERAPLSDRNWLTGKVAWEWGRRDPQASLEWVEGFATPEYLVEGINHVIAGWSETAPLDAGEYLQSRPNAEEALVKTLIRQWSFNDTEAAASWVMTTSNQIQGHAMDELMGGWTDKQPEQASQWLAQQEAGEGKDRGIMSLARVISGTDSEAALGWIASIDNPDTRTQQLVNYARRWAAKDPIAARSWAISAPLGDEDRRLVFARIGPGK